MAGQGNLVVATAEGRLRGVVRTGDVAFLGVRYAQAPFGPNRFAAPAPVTAWDGVRDALAPAPTAPQPAQGFTIIPEPIIEGGEAPSCLSLNVFTPDPGGSRLPVLVWIHGGGYTSGTPSSAWYDGRHFTRDGVVVVSVGYRLGAEGFLLIDGAPPNRAVLDWLAALEWVQRNIAPFGGDPGRVTVGGQSAGGGAAMTLATVARAAGLFHQVLSMSGTVDLVSDRATATWVTGAVAAELGVRPTVEDLAAVTPSRLVQAQTEAPRRASDAAGPPDPPAQRGSRPPVYAMPYRPVIDGDLITEAPADALHHGATHHLPVLIGATAEEFDAAMRAVEMDDARLARRLGRLGLDPEHARAYETMDAPSNGDRYGQAATDAWFRVPAVRVAESRFEADRPTFVYDFDWRSDSLGGIGAVHCLDLPFAWDLLDAEKVDVVAGQDPPQALADTVHRAWVGFVAHGDPGWPAYRADRRATMRFDTTSEVVDDLLHDERLRWS